MKRKLKLVRGMVLTLAAIALLGSCARDIESPGVEYMPDMYRSPAIEPYVDYGEVRGRIQKDLAMKQSALTPPSGTIPYQGTNQEDIELMMPWSILPNIAFKETHGLKGYDFTSEDTYNTQAAALTQNPLKLEGVDGKKTFAKAKEIYEANCIQCHGEKGDGNGKMMTNGTFVGVPNYANKKELSDGQIFYSIYYGKGSMGSHAPQLNKKEIWSLVHYVRKFQDKEYGKGMGDVEGMTEVAKVEEMDWENIDIEANRGRHMNLHITYSSNSAEIDMGKSSVDLNHMLDFMKDYADVDIILDGHTDSDGEEAMNIEISRKRAEAVKQWLVEKGIDGGRIVTHGYGETQLIRNAQGEEDKAASRRTEFIIK